MPGNPEDGIEEDAEEPRDTREIVSAVDEEGGGRELVIADIDDDGAWISMDAADAPVLSEWR
jgi:hypothetical protein